MLLRNVSGSFKNLYFPCLMCTFQIFTLPPHIFEACSTILKKVCIKSVFDNIFSLTHFTIKTISDVCAGGGVTWSVPSLCTK